MLNKYLEILLAKVPTYVSLSLILSLQIPSHHYMPLVRQMSLLMLGQPLKADFASRQSRISGGKLTLGNSNSPSHCRRQHGTLIKSSGLN